MCCRTIAFILLSKNQLKEQEGGKCLSSYFFVLLINLRLLILCLEVILPLPNWISFNWPSEEEALTYFFIVIFFMLIL